MKKPRLHRWRLLLALLLAVGTWWAIGWWQSPRLYREKQFPLTAPGLERAQRMMPSEIELAPSETTARIWDRDGKYLFVEQPWKTNQNRYSLIDLQTGRTVAENTFKFSEPLRIPEDRVLFVKASRQVAHPSGILQLPLMKAQEDPPEVVSALWEWNPFTNVLRCCREFRRAEYLKISYDGSVLLEAERCTPLWPSLLLPMNLAQGLAGLAEARLQSTDLVTLRLWALPEVKLLTTITTHHLHGQDRESGTELTKDGNYLITGAAWMPEGYTSRRVKKWEDFDSKLYVHNFTSIQVYDAHTGAKVWEKSEENQWYGVSVFSELSRPK